MFLLRLSPRSPTTPATNYNVARIAAAAVTVILAVVTAPVRAYPQPVTSGSRAPTQQQTARWPLFPAHHYQHGVQVSRGNDANGLPLYRALEDARGSQALVQFRLIDGDLNRPVAIKTFTRSGRDAENEYFILRSIQDRVSNVARLVGAYENEAGQKLIVTEYVHGMSLYDFIANRGRLTQVGVCQTIRRALKIITDLAELNVLHLDIKPDNFILANDGNVVLIDFGLACVVSRPDASSGLFYGTPNFMAPEALSHHSQTVKAEIYSLTLVWWALVTGQPDGPYRHVCTHNCAFPHASGPDRKREALRKIRQWSEHMTLPNEFTTPNERELVWGLLQYDAARRLTPQQALAHAYFAQKCPPERGGGGGGSGDGVLGSLKAMFRKNP